MKENTVALFSGLLFMADFGIKEKILIEPALTERFGAMKRS